MTLEEITEMIVGVDETAQRYESTNNTGNYTVWREYKRLPLFSDGQYVEGWAFQIDRFTRAEDDGTAKAIFEALDGDPRVSFTYQVDLETDTRYIHHIFDCEAV